MFFVLPQAPGADIRPLGYPRISSGARSRLPPLCVGLMSDVEFVFPRRGRGKADRPPRLLARKTRARMRPPGV
ncbi:MAG: hypothetical protein COA41_17985 [Sphingopyxis sp.]|nr:MAG: hypothetical protein COA41_17985 [Sphingopyxis sp.]